MADVQITGMDAYLRELEKLAGASTALCKKVVYAGADLVADEMRRAIRDLDAVSDADALAAYQKLEPTMISHTQKKGLLKSFGVAPIADKFGVISTKLGFDGYNDVKTRRWPHGQPNQLIARACESGSSAMLKQPFVRPLLKRVQKAAEFEMEKTADAELKKILGGNTNG